MARIEGRKPPTREDLNMNKQYVVENEIQDYIYSSLKNIAEDHYLNLCEDTTDEFEVYELVLVGHIRTKKEFVPI